MKGKSSSSVDEVTQITLPPKKIRDYLVGVFGVVRKPYFNEFSKVAFRSIEEVKKQYEQKILHLESGYKDELDEYKKQSTESHRKVESGANKKVRDLMERFGIVARKDSGKDLGPPIVTLKLLDFGDKEVKSFDEIMSSYGISLNSQQRECLYSRHPATNVIAGSGAGKSTVLALRVVFLITVLEVAINRVTVTTFTVESRKDFTEKLIDLMNKWGRPISLKQARNIVRTFHSVAYEMHKRLSDGRRKIVFGDKTPKLNSGDEYGASINNLNAKGANPLGEEEQDLEIPALTSILSDVYKNMYTCNSDFSSNIDTLYLLRKKKGDQKYKSDISFDKAKFVNDYDKDLSDFIWSEWAGKYSDIIDKVDKYKLNGEHDIGGLNLLYHLFFPHLNVMVFLLLPSKEYIKHYISYGKHRKEVPMLLNTKKMVAFHYASVNYIGVETPDELMGILHEERLGILSEGKTKIAPKFTFCFTGEHIKKNDYHTQIYNQFYGLIDFVYSMGKSLGDLDEGEVNNLWGRCPAGDQVFLRATKMFQEGLETQLVERGLITFNELFHKYGDPENLDFQSFDSDDLASLDYLMIDEFQDISPNIINFLNNLKSKRILHCSNDKIDSTLMTVGDDCQSIYGWRGSAVHYINDFESYFSVQTGVPRVNLIDNYRSAKLILDWASRLFPPMKVQKEYNASGPYSDCKDACFSVYRPVDRKGRTEIDYEHLTNLLQKEVARPDVTDKNPVFILYRNKSHLGLSRNKDWKCCVDDLLNRGLVKVLSIHSSKGLEAKSVFMLGEIKCWPDIPIKSGVYHWANMPTEYHQAMREETFRMAYVGITRAKSRLHWFVDNEPSLSEGVSSLYRDAVVESKLS